MFTSSETLRSVPVGHIEVIVRHAEHDGEYSLGWFAFDKTTLEALPKLVQYLDFHALDETMWDAGKRVQTQLTGRDGVVVFEIVFGGDDE